MNHPTHSSTFCTLVLSLKVDSLLSDSLLYTIGIVHPFWILKRHSLMKNKHDWWDAINEQSGYGFVLKKS